MCIFKKFYIEWRKIHLVDKCLILFMVVLLLQITFNMFLTPIDTSSTSSIDIVLRTSAAGIFGYFLSGNFIKESDTSHKKPPTAPAIGVENPLMDNLGESSLKKDLSSAELLETDPLVDNAQTPVSNNLQIILATALGLYCIGILFVVRNVSSFFPHLHDSHDILATMSQFRDFVSGCVGFLIGCPSTKRR